MSWYIAASLVQLTREINDKYAPPPWPTVSAGDGAVGDASHSARYSSHNPLWTTRPPGAVRAVDIGIRGRNARAILNELIGDPRVWYVIHKGVIYSRTYGWAANRYTGHPHDHHIHVSLREDESAYDDTRAWFGKSKPARTKGGMPVVDLSNVQRQHDERGARVNAGVKRIQRALNARYDAELAVDGLWGDATESAYVRHENSMNINHPNGRPHMHSLRHLGRGRFTVRQ